MQMEDTIVRGPGKTRSRIIAMLALALLPATLAGCRYDDPAGGTENASWTLIDPEQRHPILVSQQPATLNLRISSASDGLTPPQRARVVEFVSRSRATDSGNSRFVISAPGGSRNEGAAMAAADEVRHLMLETGYSETAISVEAYHATAGDSPLRLSYMRYVADAPDCGQDWSQNLARSYQNTAYPNFACAEQRNLAVMVANPADLLGPRTMTPRDANRRDVAYDKYIKGEPIGSAVETTVIDKATN